MYIYHPVSRRFANADHDINFGNFGGDDESNLFSYASLAYDEPPIYKAIKSAILRSPDQTFS
jgi:hypothetical protein